MTAQPVWVTPVGTLGTLPEGIAYEVSVQSTTAITLPIKNIIGNGTTVTLTIAKQLSTPFEVGDSVVVSGVAPGGYNGTFTVSTVTNTLTTTQITYTSGTSGSATVPGTVATASSTIYYQLIAGQLPYGMTIDDTGLISGTPQAIVYIDGVATPVSYDVTSEFVVRAYTTKVVSTVTVVDRFCDRTFLFTITGAGSPQWVTAAGSIGTYKEGAIVQPGIQLEYTDDNTADIVVTSLFSGTLPPGLTLNDTGLISGYVGLYVNPTYTFTLAVTNGLVTNLRTFSIAVTSLAIYTADNYLIPSWFNASSGNVTADVSSQVSPFIDNPQGSIGIARDGNYFAYQFTGIDLYGGPVGFIGTNLPPDLTLDASTGWLYGILNSGSALEEIYNFQVQIYPGGQPGLASLPYSYSLTVEAQVATGITWITPSDLGTIDTGTPSTLFVEAVDISGITLLYRLDPGSTNVLPDGLTLQSDGTITGTVAFNPTVLDCSFTVEAYSADLSVDVFKTFTITVIQATEFPYDNLYIKCMPPLAESQYIQTLLSDSTIFTTDLIYRPNDINFGVAKNITYYHAYGLTADTVEAYVDSLSLNHYWKQLTLGQIKTARALDDSGNTLYEVVYCEVVDNLINNLGETVDKEVVLPYPLNPGTIDQIDTVWPNGLVDMRNQVIDVVGQVSNILPRWMLSKQTDGTVLGFTPAWVIAYCNPNSADRVLYNIEQSYPSTFNTIDFKADRYELDKSLTYNWDPVTQTWLTVSLPAPTIGSDQYDAYLMYPKYNVITDIPSG